MLQLAQELLEQVGGLAGLLHASLADLARIKGLGGSAKRAELSAVLELARRALAEQLKERPAFDSPDAVKNYLRLAIGARPHEVFAVLFLDAQRRLIAVEELFRGTLTQTSAYPREVVARALHLHAAAVVARNKMGQRLRRALGRRRGAHAEPEGRAGPGGYARARPCDRRPGRGAVDGGMWTTSICGVREPSRLPPWLRRH